ncbi:MAG: ABC transporter substrate-binding protein [Saccharolobus sp.]|uniref:ABC transporter substrate-binding protein n=1 Tax=Saccharolobus sp. TaxID=2100761 RepID=UPI0031769CB2
MKVEQLIVLLLVISLVLAGVNTFIAINLSGSFEKLHQGLSELSKAVAGAYTVTPPSTVTPTAEVLPSEIRIGVIVPLTGPNAYNGFLMSRGALVAEKAINQMGGVLGRPVKVIIEDETPTAEGAVLAAEKLITVDKVVGIVGFYKSFTTKAVMESVISKYGVPLFTAGWSDALTAAHNKYVFRAGPLISGQIDQWVEFIEWLAKKTGRKRFAAYSENTDYGVEFQSAVVKKLKEHGIVEVVVDLYHDYLATDFTTDLIKIKEAKPEIFWTATVSSNVMTMIKQADAIGLKKEVIMLAVADGFYYTDEYKKVVGESGDLVIVTSFHKAGTIYTEWTPIMDQIYKELGFGEDIEFYITLQVCQDVLLLAQAINKAGSINPDKIVKALETYEFMSPWGKIKFMMEPTGPYYHQWIPSMLFLQFQGLQLKVVYPPELAETELVLPS